jgi:acyl-CoA synthetase (AMP-forming)/AMP-acid ligase II
VIDTVSAVQSVTCMLIYYIAFTQLLALSEVVASNLLDCGIPILHGETGVVSLICPTGLEFLLAWLALMRMGYGVVFIAWVGELSTWKAANES